MWRRAWGSPLWRAGQRLRSGQRGFASNRRRKRPGAIVSTPAVEPESEGMLAAGLRLSREFGRKTSRWITRGPQKIRGFWNETGVVFKYVVGSFGAVSAGLASFLAYNYTYLNHSDHPMVQEALHYIRSSTLNNRWNATDEETGMMIYHDIAPGNWWAGGEEGGVRQWFFDVDCPHGDVQVVIEAVQRMVQDHETIPLTAQQVRKARDSWFTEDPTGELARSHMETDPHCIAITPDAISDIFGSAPLSPPTCIAPLPQQRVITSSRKEWQMLKMHVIFLDQKKYYTFDPKRKVFMDVPYQDSTVKWYVNNPWILISGAAVGIMSFPLVLYYMVRKRDDLAFSPLLAKAVKNSSSIQGHVGRNVRHINTDQVRGKMKSDSAHITAFHIEGDQRKAVMKAHAVKSGGKEESGVLGTIAKFVGSSGNGRWVVNHCSLQVDGRNRTYSINIQDEIDKEQGYTPPASSE